MDDDDLLFTILVWSRTGVSPRDVWPQLAGMAIPSGCEMHITWGRVFDLMRDWQSVFAQSFEHAA